MAKHKGLLDKSELEAAIKAAGSAVRDQEGLDLRGLVENRRKALEALAFNPLTITPIPIWTAFEINRSPLNIPFAEHLEPGNNWAQIDFEMGYDRKDHVDVWFQFGWQNPSNSEAVISAECDLVLKGIGRAEAHAAELHGAHAKIDLSGQLDLVTTQMVPGPEITIDNSLHLDTPAGIAGGGDLYLDAPYSGMFHLANDARILVDPFEAAVLSVKFIAKYDVDHGQVVLNFSASDNSIMCPGVLINLLTPPPVIRA